MINSGTGHKEQSNPAPAEKEIRYMQNMLEMKYRWFAKDKNCVCCAFRDKPIKNESIGKWVLKNSMGIYVMPWELSFLSWEDREPFYFKGGSDGCGV